MRWLIVAGAVVAVGIVLASGGLVTAIQLENRNAFCASCHTEPESEYYQRSLAAPVDLASAHNAKNVPCIQCHSGPGATGRVEAITSVAAPDTFAFYSGHYRKPATVTVPLGDEHCLKCHADVTIPAGLQQPLPCLPFAMAGPGAEGCGNLRGVPSRT